MKFPFTQIAHKSKIFVTSKTYTVDAKKFLKIVERSNHIISLYFTLPKTDKGRIEDIFINRDQCLLTFFFSSSFFIIHRSETLEKLSIPSYDPAASKPLQPIQNSLTNGLSTLSNSHTRQMESKDVVDAVMNSPPLVQYNMDYKSTVVNSQNHQMEPESNSEDSSLSDGDRTLVGDVSPMLSNSPACSDQHLSSPDDHTKINGDTYGDDDTDMLDVNQMKNYYFKATYYEEPAFNDGSEEPVQTLKVLVHRHMNIANLKRVLEPYIKVPMEYFKIFRINSSQTETECTRLTEDLRNFK